MALDDRPLVSITLPSLREELVRQRIADFAETNPNVDYEIVVVSPFVVEGDRVRHVPEPLPQGAIAAQWQAFAESRGRYLVWTSDDAIPSKDCLSHMVDFVGSKPEPFIGSFRLKKSVGSRLTEAAQAVMFGRRFACWGCASRQTVEIVGGYFDKIYHATHGDVDLSLRCWKAGGKVATCPNAWFTWSDAADYLKTSAYISKWVEIDGVKFRDRWNPLFGEKSWRPTWQGGGASPLSFRQNPASYLAWSLKLLPKRFTLFKRMLQINLYPVISKSPLYTTYKRLRKTSQKDS